MPSKKTSVIISEATQRQLDTLKAMGFGGQTSVIRIAVDRMHRDETKKEKAMFYISAWEVFQSKEYQRIREGLDSGEITRADTVWSGPSGDYVVATSPAELDEDYSEFTDRGTVGEWLEE